MRITLLTAALAVMVLAGCGEEEVQDVEDVARPVKTMVIDAPDAGGSRRFPANIESGRRATLAFRVSPAS